MGICTTPTASLRIQTSCAHSANSRKLRSRFLKTNNMNQNKKYCLRLTPSEYEKMLTQMRTRGIRCMSTYAYHQLFGVHKNYEYRQRKISTPHDLLASMSETIALVNLVGQEINRITRHINARGELRKDGMPAKLSGMIQHFDRKYDNALKKVDKCILKTIGETIAYAEKHNIDYEK